MRQEKELNINRGVMQFLCQLYPAEQYPVQLFYARDPANDIT